MSELFDFSKHMKFDFSKHMKRQENKSVYLLLDHTTCNRYIVLAKETSEDGHFTKFIRIDNDIWVRLHSTDWYMREDGINDLLSLLYEELRKQ
jgi:hypothetical protein